MHETLPDRLAFTDLETTNSWPPSGEIIELGVVISSSDLTITERKNWKLQPQHIATASPDVLRYNHYSEEDWADAVDPAVALQEYVSLVRGAGLCTWRIAYDFVFVQEALERCGLFDKKIFDTHICVYSMALQALRHEPITPFRLHQVATFLGIPPEPSPHRAINGAEQAFEIYKKLLTYGR